MKISKDTLRWMYRTMVTIRRFDERLHQDTSAQPGFGTIHFSVGQEAVPTGICAHLTSSDFLASTHRPHGHLIAKGVSLKGITAELFGKASGTNSGKGGDMHIADLSVGMLGANGIVCSSIPLACGAALKSKIQGTGQVAVAFFGDGGAGQGILYESMNLASIWKLPLVFVCENNLYANSTPVEYAIAGENIADRAAGFSMPGLIADGMDVFSVYEQAAKAISRARKGGGPTLLECKTYRYYGHYLGDNPRNYRLKEEEDDWHKRDPIHGFRNRVLGDGSITSKELDEVDRDIEALIDEAVKFAKEAPLPDARELLTDVYQDYPLQALSKRH